MASHLVATFAPLDHAKDHADPFRGAPLRPSLCRRLILMLFNSFPFLFLFLPITFAGFFGLARWSPRLAAGWLVAASFFFYGWWNPRYVLLLAISATFNYGMGKAIARAPTERARRRMLTFGVATDLLLLAYYKYVNFILLTVGALVGHNLGTIDQPLPLGISFFTFTQIAFLVDVSRGVAAEFDPVHYGLFVTYYPHLIAGPVLHHKEMMPQFARADTYRAQAPRIASGLTVFVFGLFKKVIVADRCGPWAAAIFDKTPASDLTLVATWVGAVAYALQIYFDFSGYSDMAIGISRLFGIELPLNFNSPYQATSISDFWRRWHMTLSRFLRDYLYIPLGGNRRGAFRRHANLMITMLLGGLWHGAGWTFVIWGGLHGSYLIINHAWTGLRGERGDAPSAWRSALGGLFTFAAVTFAWVFFRATTFQRAWLLVGGMFGRHGTVLPSSWRALPGGALLSALGVRFEQAALVDKARLIQVTALLAFAMLAPNSQRVMERWKPNAAWLALVVVMAGVVIVNLGGHVSEFLYYRF